MDCTCNCFGVATAARVPVKRYNLLVPDVFPVVEPPFDKPLGITIERKIKKLAEYLDKNEFRAPKVGRAAGSWLCGVWAHCGGWWVLAACGGLKLLGPMRPLCLLGGSAEPAAAAPHATLPARTPWAGPCLQVSRRLQRRLHKELGAGHYGYVKLAAETYAYLLVHNKPEKSNLLANELVVRTVVKRRK